MVLIKERHIIVKMIEKKDYVMVLMKEFQMVHMMAKKLVEKRGVMIDVTKD